jgi:hypothetical protein
VYTTEDIRLLAALDERYNTLSGPTSKKCRVVMLDCPYPETQTTTAMTYLCFDSRKHLKGFQLMK